MYLVAICVTFSVIALLAYRKPVKAVVPRILMRDVDYIESLAHWDEGDIDEADLANVVSLVAKPNGRFETDLASWRLLPDPRSSGQLKVQVQQKGPIIGGPEYGSIAELALNDPQLRRALLRKRHELAKA